MLPANIQLVATVVDELRDSKTKEKNDVTRAQVVFGDAPRNSIVQKNMFIISRHVRAHACALKCLYVHICACANGACFVCLRAGTCTCMRKCICKYVNV